MVKLVIAMLAFSVVLNAIEMDINLFDELNPKDKNKAINVCFSNLHKGIQEKNIAKYIDVMSLQDAKDCYIIFTRLLDIWISLGAEPNELYFIIYEGSNIFGDRILMALKQNNP